MYNWNQKKKRSKGFYFIYKVNKSQKTVTWMFRKATWSKIESRKYMTQVVAETKGILCPKGLNGDGPAPFIPGGLLLYTAGCSTRLATSVFLQKSTIRTSWKKLKENKVYLKIKKNSTFRILQHYYQVNELCL